jgi:hypothetical protein
MDTARSSSNGPTVPMRVEIRLWDLEHALLLDPSSFDVVRDEVELEHSTYIPNCDLADRSKPTLTVEVRFEHQVGSESRLHTPHTPTKQPQVNWLHSPLRSRLVEASLREVLVFSLHPIALEGLVEFRLYQWACLSEEQLAALQHQQLHQSRSYSGNDDTLCSVSEQDESELVAHQATAKLCIGCLRVPLRSLLQLDRQVRLKLQIDSLLRREVQHCSDDVYDAIAGVKYGGVASISCHVSAFFAECVLPAPPSTVPGQRSPPRRQVLSSIAENGLLLTDRAASQESGASSSSQYSLIGTDTIELRLLLVPMRIVNDIIRIILDVVLWRRPLATCATLLLVVLASLFELYHVLGVVLLMAGTIRCTRAARLATNRAMNLGAEVENVVMLYPPHYAFLNSIIRGDLWLQAGHSDEAFLEVMHLMRRVGQRAASLSVMLWGIAAVYMWLPIDIFVPIVATVALLVYPLKHTVIFGISIRKRTNGGGDIALGPCELLLPKPFTRTPLPVTRIVKAYVPYLNTSLTRASTMSPRGSSFRKDIAENTLPPQRSSSSPAEGKASSGPSQQPSPSAARPPAAVERHAPQEDIITGGATQTFMSSDVELSPDSPDHHKIVDYKPPAPTKEPQPPAPRVPKLQLNSQHLPPPPPLSARAQRLESDNASGSRASSERIETPRQRATPRLHSQSQQEPLLVASSVTDVMPPPRRQSGNVAPTASTHRRTQSQLITAAPSFSYAVVTVEWRDDHMSDVTGHAGVRSLYHTNSSAASNVMERMRQFYQKLEVAEQRLSLDNSRHSQPSFVLESTGSVNSSAGLTSTTGKGSSQYVVHDTVVGEATLLLLYLRRMWKTAVVHVSTSSVSAAESAGTAVDRLERVANPGTLMEHVSNDQVTSTLLTGFAQLPVIRLAGARGLDENCRAWALLCMCFLSGRRASLFAAHGQPKISFLIPLQPHALTFDVSAGGTASCPPPLAPALQDLWRGWKENKDSHGLVTLDMILTIISAHRDFWKHPTIHTSSPSLATPMPPMTNAVNGLLGVPMGNNVSRRSSHQRPFPNSSPLRPTVHDSLEHSAGPTMTSAGSWVMVHNDLKSPLDAAAMGNTAGLLGSPPVGSALLPHTAASTHDTPFLDYFAGGVSNSFESEASGITSTKNRRSVYESLGIKSQRKERDSPEVVDAMHAAGAAPTTPLPRGLSPLPPSPQKSFSDAFPSFAETKQYSMA